MRGQLFIPGAGRMVDGVETEPITGSRGGKDVGLVWQAGNASAANGPEGRARQDPRRFVELAAVATAGAECHDKASASSWPSSGRARETRNRTIAAEMRRCQRRNTNAHNGFPTGGPQRGVAESASRARELPAGWIHKESPASNPTDPNVEPGKPDLSHNGARQRRLFVVATTTQQGLAKLSTSDSQ